MACPPSVGELFHYTSTHASWLNQIGGLVQHHNVIRASTLDASAGIFHRKNRESQRFSI